MSHPDSQILLAVGQLQGHIASLERAMVRELYAIRRETMGHIMLLHRKIVSDGGHTKKRFPWLSVAGIAITLVTSLLGFMKPETAATIIRGLVPH